ncbi:MAG: carbamoyltransferase C-terminal domain-containing protein [Pseudomonadota bacterium]
MGLNLGHDRAISFVSDGPLSFHTAIERLDRRKHSESPDYPVAEINRVLDHLGIAIDDIAGVCLSYLGSNPERISETMAWEFRQEFPGFRGDFSTLDHHNAHAIGAQVCSGFNETLVLVADGAGDERLWGTQAESLISVNAKTCQLIDERVQSMPRSQLNRPKFYDPAFFRADDATRQISLGLKYEQITYLCGFGPGQAGQTMALAAYGEPLFDYQRYLPSDLSFSLTYPDFLREFTDLASSRKQTLREFAKSNRADIAATYQAYLEEALVRISEEVVRRHKPDALCFAGGIFLNCLSNRKITNALSQTNLYFLPACGDDGQSIGTAAYAYWRQAERFPEPNTAFPYLGRGFSSEECEKAVAEAGLAGERLFGSSRAERLAQLLAEGKIVGVLQGRSEAGPRALGHRSILADPRSPTTKPRIDAGIKRRAEFRPYAPMMLRECVGDITDFASASPHMLITADVREQHRLKLPAITHIDNSTRAQTVTEEIDPFLFALLTAFEHKTGYGVLLNTSFNDESEPIVDSPEDAIRTFLRTELDALLLEEVLVTKSG